MTELEFFAVVAKMRAAARKYYSLSAYHPDKKYWLNESKRLESIIDAEIGRRLKMTDAAVLKDAYARFEKGYTPQLNLDL